MATDHKCPECGLFWSHTSCSNYSAKDKDDPCPVHFDSIKYPYKSAPFYASVVGANWWYDESEGQFEAWVLNTRRGVHDG